MHTTVNDYSFKEEIRNSNSLIIVNFWAPWCTPCKMIHPILNEITNDYHEFLKVITINTDSNPTTAMEYNVRSIPTLIIIKNGELLAKITGAVPKSTVLQLVNQLL
uniref:thioredoxin n=1 Tax=Goniotrichopsis reniformis TaxID=468933 RepID=UPI001FCD652E|nr:thioredoxin [Goniotrichopsis reniformis]UNJ14707.1 thioredoxin [Goniotrichopsis reniformis]